MRRIGPARKARALRVVHEHALLTENPRPIIQLDAHHVQRLLRLDLCCVLAGPKGSGVMSIEARKFALNVAKAVHADRPKMTP